MQCWMLCWIYNSKIEGSYNPKIESHANNSKAIGRNWLWWSDVVNESKFWPSPIQLRGRTSPNWHASEVNLWKPQWCNNVPLIKGLSSSESDIILIYGQGRRIVCASCVVPMRDVYCSVDSMREVLARRDLTAADKRSVWSLVRRRVIIIVMDVVVRTVQWRRW